MLKKIFSSYGSENTGLKIINIRKMSNLARDFNFFQKISSFDETKLNLLFIKIVPHKKANFREFIDLLYNIAKYRNPQLQDRIKVFRSFLEDIIVPKYKEFSKNLILYGIDYIQIFYKDYNPYENPTLILLFQNEDLFKHVLLYMSISP